MARQLTLPVGLRDDSTLDNFLATVNAEAFAAVQALLDGRQSFVYLCGDEGVGRTHLLEAAVDCAARAGRSVAYVALDDPASLAEPGLLGGLGDAALVCLDNVDAIAGVRRWEEAIFHLFNDLRANGGTLLVAAAAAPAMVKWDLPDLASRMSSGLLAALAPHDDESRAAILMFRARRRGLDLPPETAAYLLARVSRRLDDLLALLASLDQAALEARQQRLTVPFVRRWLQV